MNTLFKTLITFIIGFGFCYGQTDKINISPLTINPMLEGKSYTITASLNEPVICSDVSTDCYVIVKYDNPNPDLISINPCYIVWYSDEWHKTKTITVSVTGSFRNMKDTIYTLTSKGVDTNTEYYQDSTIPDINLHFKGVATGSCSGTGDPHYTTFDGYYYHYYGRGKEWLVKSNDKNTLGFPILQIQTITHGSGYSRNCALAMLEDGNYVMISVCSGRVDIFNRYLNTRTTSHPTIKRNGGNGYIIQFPETGTTGTINFWGRNANVYITLGGKYYQSIDGMCGNWDGNRNNEGNPGYRINEWYQLPAAWRVVSGSDDDLFSISNNKILRSIDDTGINGNGDNVKDCVFKPKQYIVPIITQPNVEDITDLLRTLVPDSGDDILDNDELIFDLTDFEDAVEQERDDTFNDLDENEQQALLNELQQQCQDFRKNEAIWDCIDSGIINIDNAISECIEDAQLTLSKDVVNQNWKGVVTICQTQQLIDTDTDEEAQQIIEIFCSGACDVSQNCIGNACLCIDASKKGSTCQFDKSAEPHILEVHPSIINLYDYNLGTKNEILLHTDNIAFDDNVKCNIDGSVLGESFGFNVNASMVSEGFYTCDISQTAGRIRTIIGSDNMVKLNITISSDNSASNTITQKYIYSQCLKCAINDGICHKRNTFCYTEQFQDVWNFNDESTDAIYSTLDCYYNNSRFDIFNNPCLICTDNTAIIDWEYGDCYPRINYDSKYISDTYVESDTTTYTHTHIIDMNDILRYNYPGLESNDYFDIKYLDIVFESYNHTDTKYTVNLDTNINIHYTLSRDSNQNFILESEIDIQDIITHTYRQTVKLYLFYNDGIQQHSKFIDSIDISITVLDNSRNNPTTSTTTTKGIITTKDTTTSTTESTTTTTTTTTTTSTTTTTTTTKSTTSFTFTTRSTTKSTTTTTTSTTTSNTSSIVNDDNNQNEDNQDGDGNEQGNDNGRNNKQRSISKNVKMSTGTLIMIIIFSIAGIMILTVLSIYYQTRSKYNRYEQTKGSGGKIDITEHDVKPGMYNITIESKGDVAFMNPLYKYEYTMNVIQGGVDNPMYMEIGKYYIAKNIEKGSTHKNKLILTDGNNFGDDLVKFDNAFDLLEYYHQTQNPVPLQGVLGEQVNNNEFEFATTIVKNMTNGISNPMYAGTLGAKLEDGGYMDVVSNEPIYGYDNDKIKGTRIENSLIINQTYDANYIPDDENAPNLYDKVSNTRPSYTDV